MALNLSISLETVELLHKRFCRLARLAALSISFEKFKALDFEIPPAFWPLLAMIQFDQLHELSQQGIYMSGGFFTLWILLYNLSGVVSGHIWLTYNKLDKYKQVEWNSRYEPIRTSCNARE